MTRHTSNDYATLNLSEVDPSRIRGLMGGCVGPRPIALITTLGPDGVVNAAPYANFMGVSSDPVLVAFALGRKGDLEKDTLANVRENGEFVVNVVSVEMAEAMNHTAADYPRNRSEVGPAGLSTLPGEAVAVARIAESPIHLECRLFQLVEIGAPVPSNAIVLGEVLRIHARRDLMGDGPSIRAAGWNPLGGLGDDYVKPGEIFSLSFAKPLEE